MLKAFITGLAGPQLSAAETEFLSAARPCGIILFTRNCESHAQIRSMIAAAKLAVGAGDLLVLIDQEGGRVQRLRPPLGRALPPAAAYAALYARDEAAACRAAHHAAQLVAHDLASLGINTDCAPVLDVPVAGSHTVIGDRAYGATPEQVARIGRRVAEGFLAQGMLPVIKHIPGHGRATKDSHLDLPVVTTARRELARTDFKAFKQLADMPAAMTAHVVFTDIDAAHPASTSPTVTQDIIRGEIGFDGLLMSDDLSMKALSGSLADRAAAVIAAGSDIALHCNGELGEMQQVAASVPVLAGKALDRFRAAIAVTQRRQAFDVAAAEADLAAVLAGHAVASESV
jgi:beta-N-acetylhexosaminidase